jgi:hypothetical protein
MLRPTYPILTRRLLLRPFAMDDLAGLHAIQSRLDVTRYLMWGRGRWPRCARCSPSVRGPRPWRTKATR